MAGGAGRRTRPGTIRFGYGAEFASFVVARSAPFRGGAQAAPDCLDADRVADASTILRWARRRIGSLPFWLAARQFFARPPSSPGICGVATMSDAEFHAFQPHFAAGASLSTRLEAHSRAGTRGSCGTLSFAPRKPSFVLCEPPQTGVLLPWLRPRRRPSPVSTPAPLIRRVTCRSQPSTRPRRSYWSTPIASTNGNSRMPNTRGPVWPDAVSGTLPSCGACASAMPRAPACAAIWRGLMIRARLCAHAALSTSGAATLSSAVSLFLYPRPATFTAAR